MAESKLNIFQKLIEVRKSVPGLSKDKKNNFYKFSYVSSSQTLAAVRTAMDEHQLLLIPEITNHETRDHTTQKGGHQFFTILWMKYTWINAENPQEKIECSWLGHGIDETEKGPGKGVTYSEKYFLLKFFNIPTDKDDPDADGKPNGNKKPPQGQKQDPSTDEETIKKLDFIAKIMANASKATQLQCPADATPEDKNKTCSEILVQWSAYEFKDEKTGKMVQCKTASGREDLKKFKLSRLQAIYGTSKKSVSNLEAVVDPPPAAADVGDGQEGLPF